MPKQLISIIVPVYNEALNIPLLYKELSKHIRRLPYRFELIFVDDGSADDSVNILRKLAQNNDNIRLICLARNFGKEPATSAGIHAARGDAAIVMDADLQMPPNLLSKFIKKWQNGADVVVGVFSARKMSPIRKVGAHCFYRIMQAIAHTKLTPHATDYRLLDRKVINAFNQLTERNRINRGLVDWLGFERDYIHFEQAERQNGGPTYSFRKLIALAINSFISHSMVPLKMAGYLGVLILSLAIPAGIFMYVEMFVLGDPMGLAITGTAYLAMLILFLVGVILACLGMISLYIAHIHAEVTNRPLYVIRDTHDPITQASVRRELVPQTAQGAEI